MRRHRISRICVFLLLSLFCVIFQWIYSTVSVNRGLGVTSTIPFEIMPPEYSGSATAWINNNEPSLSTSLIKESSYISLSQLDDLGRCGVAFGYLGPELLPTEPRGEIGMIKPAGWHTVKYDFVDGKYLYNRCHLLAYELSGINADERNLITGTRYLNLDGMLSYENQVYRYIQTSGNHVLYRATPWYEGFNLIASGVQIEAYSVEDFGEGICFNVFCFNVQPGVIIDYQTGDSTLEAVPDEEADSTTPEQSESEIYVPSDGVTYVINTNTFRFHLPGCQSVQEMKAQNRYEYLGDREDLIEDGYTPCGRCHP